MDDKQGVQSIIKFPVGQDEIAVSRAIGELLSEGWKFDCVMNQQVLLIRTWEYDPNINRGAMEIKSEPPR